MKCEHCNLEIKDLKYLWSRGRKHWCCKCCYEQDQNVISPTELVGLSFVTENELADKNAVITSIEESDL